VSHANDVIPRHRRKLLFQQHAVPPTHLPDSVEAPLDYRPRTKIGDERWKSFGRGFLNEPE